METFKMTLLVLTVTVLLFNSAAGIFFDDEESHISKIRIHVFQPPPKIKPSKVVRHVHFNIQKPPPPKPEVHHPHEITIPLTINPTVYTPDHHHTEHHHTEHHPHGGFSQGYAQGYLENNGIVLGSSGSHPPKDPDIHYDLPQYTDDAQPQYPSQPQYPAQPQYPSQPLDYGGPMYPMPNIQYADEMPYDLQAQYGDDMYSGPPGPTARALGGGAYATGPTGVEYSPLQQQPKKLQPTIYREIKYPW